MSRPLDRQPQAAGGAAFALPPAASDAQFWLRWGALLAFAAVFAAFAASSPLFLTVANLANVLQQSVVIGLLGFGLTVVLIGGGPDPIRGGLDLSVAANLGLCAAVQAVALRDGATDGAALALMLATGAAVGALNAFAVIVLRIFPLLATLTTMNLCAGFELVLTQNTSVAAASPLLAFLLDNGPFDIPHLAYALPGAALLFTVLVHRTRFGLRLAATGAHRHAARAAGLRVNAYVAASYVLSGIAAALAALASSALLSGSAPGAGENLLAVVAAALLGVVFSRRLVPTVPGTLLAVLFVGIVGNGFQLDNVSSYWINGVEGALILFVVATTAVIRRRHTEDHAHD
ncbi:MULTISPECIES: ABC transporter permease [Burkholderia]|uniref:ABC transporter permease n=1 Tax=Burkholderia TaxID=32008 RepID=UPI000503DA01|nr:ABC transporter permease [Burkholderia pyrrocinia]EKS9887017.1 ABC transporter permease [Burkholderia pyrrocinia]EKS9892477.1 ABC transporter permease [Burkholderia pyrrocinia]KFL50070.1 ABC transporter permease [Burkholderia pyrrocinia]TDA47109.1 ABC transporter permease [Burkholderia pyrrocinia]UOB60203.1 ABC transporter permease [Burkholderia pyrrocinia]